MGHLLHNGTHSILFFLYTALIILHRYMLCPVAIEDSTYVYHAIHKKYLENPYLAAIIYRTLVVSALASFEKFETLPEEYVWYEPSI